MKGFRTIAFNIANALVFAMSAVSDQISIPPDIMPWWIGGLLAGNVVLRLVTTGPVGSKE